MGLIKCFNVSITFNYFYCGAPLPSTYIITNECVYDSIYFSHQVSTPTDIIRFLKKSYTDNVTGLIKCFNVLITLNYFYCGAPLTSTYIITNKCVCDLI